MIYGTAKDGLLRLLDPVHNAALRLCTGAFRSSSVVRLYSDSGEIPLSEQRLHLTLQFYSHIELLLTSPTYHCLHSNPLELSVQSIFAFKVHSVLSMLNMTKFKITPVTIQDTPIWKQSTDTICDTFYCSTKKDYNAEDLKALFLEHQEVEQGRSIQIYTDGSKTDTEVGSAAVMNNQIISMKLN